MNEEVLGEQHVLAALRIWVCQRFKDRPFSSAISAFKIYFPKRPGTRARINAPRTYTFACRGVLSIHDLQAWFTRNNIQVELWTTLGAALSIEIQEALDEEQDSGEAGHGVLNGEERDEEPGEKHELSEALDVGVVLGEREHEQTGEGERSGNEDGDQHVGRLP